MRLSIKRILRILDNIFEVYDNSYQSKLGLFPRGIPRHRRYLSNHLYVPLLSADVIKYKTT